MNRLNNNQNMIEQFQQFKMGMAGKDPNKMLNDLVSSGKVTKQQLDQAKMMAKAFSGILK